MKYLLPVMLLGLPIVASGATFDLLRTTNFSDSSPNDNFQLVNWESGQNSDSIYKLFEVAAWEKPVASIDGLPTQEGSIPIYELLFSEQSVSDVWNVPSSTSDELPSSIWKRILFDHRNMYQPESISNLGFAVGAAAIVADSNLDGQIQKHFRASVFGALSDEWYEALHANKELGNGFYTLPIFATAWASKEWIDGPPWLDEVGTWGERSMRGFMVGAPPTILLQRLTGSSRPHETEEGSEWHPMRDNNGVSGHAFMSALPFITAAKMADNKVSKAVWYAGSTLGPLSRVNDEAHYPSQIALGWTIAFLAASAVNQTDTGKQGWSIVPNRTLTGSGFGLIYRW